MDQETSVTNSEASSRAPLAEKLGRSGLVAGILLVMLLGTTVSVSLAQQTTPPVTPAPATPAAPGALPGAVAVPTTLAPLKPGPLVVGTYVYTLDAGVTEDDVTDPSSVTGALIVEGAVGNQQRHVMRWLQDNGVVGGIDDVLYEFADDGIYLVSAEGAMLTFAPKAKFEPLQSQLVTPWPAQVGKIWTGHVISTNGCQVLATRVKVEDDSTTIEVDGMQVPAIRLIRLTERSSTDKAGCSEFAMNETTTSWISLKYGLVQEHRIISETSPDPFSWGYTLRLVEVPSDPAPAPAPPPVLATQ